MKIEIIPALDIIDGKCVRLSQGDYDKKKIYSENPLEVAKRMEDAGITRLHVVDLDGALSAGIVNLKLLEKLCSQTSLTIDFGGGIKTEDDIEAAFQSGVAMVTVGSMAVR
ncbi:MAG: HisA/HisF-related TIM barrel protein, partial [Bacteroidaceae bacterium]